MRADLDLLEAWKEGDASAGRELFARHFNSVFRFFRNKVDGVAEDLTQQTFMACVRGRDSFRGDSSFRTYLFMIARKRLYSYLRERHRKGVDALGELSIADVSGPSPSGVMAGREEQRLLLRALRRLPLDMQVALELHYWEDLKVREIAEVLEVPSGTIKRRLQRARLRLDEIMAELSESPALLQSTVDNFSAWAQGLRQALAPGSE
ncbi:MAG: RNA polymerase sigma factor [Myxococcales bacterium]|nr:RNA polymerase sigma factor [Myxococcales bacterium]